MKASSEGFFVILTGVLLCLICYLLRYKWQPKKRYYDRDKDIQLRRRISESLETSLPIHLDVASSLEGDLAGGSALAAISAAVVVSPQMAFADEPWIVSCGTGTLSCFERDAVKTGLATVDYGNDLAADNTDFSGFSPISHAIASLCSLNGARTTLHLNIGAFGPGIILQDMVFPANEGICVVSDDLLSQASGVLCSDELYIGEQSFEIPQVLNQQYHKAVSLIAMDILRLIFILSASVYSLFKLLV